MRLLDDSNGRAEPIQNAPRRVGRTVVDDDELERAIRLREDAADGALDACLPVVDRQDHRDLGQGHRGFGRIIPTLPVGPRGPVRSSPALASCAVGPSPFALPETPGPRKSVLLLR